MLNFPLVLSEKQHGFKNKICFLPDFSFQLSLISYKRSILFKYNFLCEQPRYYKGLDKLGLDETPQVARGA